MRAGVVDAEMPAGSLLVWDGAVWHGSGENRTTDRFRTSINLNFNLSWLRQQETSTSAFPARYWPAFRSCCNVCWATTAACSAVSAASPHWTTSGTTTGSP